jgi:ribonuclease HI
MNEICIFTDGSSLNNQEKGKRRGGVGVFFGDNDERNISIPLKESDKNKVTNQVTELLACIKGIETINSSPIKKNCHLVIYTDSMYVINIMTKWAINWEKNNWTKRDGKIVDNIELVKKLYYYYQTGNIVFRHVRSHMKEPEKNDPTYKMWYGNNKADKLAVSAAQSI